MKDRRALRRPPCFSATLFSFLLSSLALGQSYQDLIGFTALQNRLGNATPTGAGIAVMQVEAPSGAANAYLPAPAPGTTIIDRTTGGTTSGHATSVADIFFGGNSIAQGITLVDAYNANHWVDDGGLRFGQSVGPRTLNNPPGAPPASPVRVQNHSYIGSATVAEATELLRRKDLQIDRDGIISVVGVNNGSGSNPQLWSSSYNAISVGLTNGNSSGGSTAIDDSGRGLPGDPKRTKPDIVAPANFTSFATPMVAAASALLLETGVKTNDLAAQRPETIRALLLAGASKSPFPSWGVGRPADGSQPLDSQFGAGQLNIDTSHRILEAHEQDPGTVAGRGFDLGEITTSALPQFTFTVPTGLTINSLTIAATWNRRISIIEDLTGQTPAVLTPSLADIDLFLSRFDETQQAFLPVDQSISNVDNLQYIFRRNLLGGTYRFSLTTDRTWQYAIAWDIVFSQVPEPSPVLLLLAAVVLIGGCRFSRRRWRRSAKGSTKGDQAS